MDRLTIEEVFEEIEKEEKLEDLVEEMVEKIVDIVKDGDKTIRYTYQKCECGNIGFKEVYNTNGILFVLSYNKETGKILDIVEIPDTNPLSPSPLEKRPYYPWDFYQIWCSDSTSEDLSGVSTNNVDSDTLNSKIDDLDHTDVSTNDDNEIRIKIHLDKI